MKRKFKMKKKLIIKNRKMIQKSTRVSKKFKKP